MGSPFCEKIPSGSIFLKTRVPELVVRRMVHFDEGRSPAGAYGYEMHAESVPLEFFNIYELWRPEPFFHEEHVESLNAEERPLKHMRPPTNAWLQVSADIVQFTGVLQPCCDLEH